MEDEDLEFRINTDFAEKYDNWRRKEELQKLKDRYGEDAVDQSSSSSESEDEDAEALTPQLERDFLKTLSYVKSHDPRIYKKDEIFYDYKESDGVQPTKTKTKKDKPMYLKDLERKLILEKNGEMSDSDEDGENEEERPWSPSYVEEQQMLKDSFKNALEDSGNEEEEAILQKKPKSDKQKEEEEADYVSWLKDQGEKTDAPVQEMKALKQYWNDPKLDDGEKFLRDYILNKGYIDKGSEENVPNFHELAEDEVEFSEEERLLDEQEDFERKYNFRFEEPDSDFIKRYPRTVADSVRRKDKKRADKRQEIKTRKEEEKQRMKEDLKQLKNMKKKEIMEKLDKLRHVTGSVPVHFQNEDLEGDFDPEEHDKLMKKIFNEGYEEKCDDQTKPEFNDDELEIENWDEWNGEEYENEDYVEEDVHCEDSHFNMDADYIPPPSRTDFGEEMTRMTGKKKRRRASKFAQAVGHKKPVFNPDDGAFDDYVDEYYKLDYEDMIAGIPCRFKYRNVIANDFGLTTDNILNAREKELNQWASLKKTCQYRSETEETKDLKAYSAKVKYSDKFKKVFTSLYSDKSDDVEEDSQEPRKKFVKQKKAFTKHQPSDGDKNDAQEIPNHKSNHKSNHKHSKTKKSQIDTNVDKNKDTSKANEKEFKLCKKELEKKQIRKQNISKKSKRNDEISNVQRKNKSYNSMANQTGKNLRNKLYKRNERAISRSSRRQELSGRRKIGNTGIDVSDARLKAYGIDPRKYTYRMKFLAKLKSRKERLQKKHNK
ncbi:protein KRI1 homolog [Antedon mediterranea]|uniref:protein KRI1 homolog n=1 Tax=Antedon mediterranea TaxID=105859 RepID=UPI003AF8E4A2